MPDNPVDAIVTDGSVAVSGRSSGLDRDGNPGTGVFGQCQPGNGVVGSSEQGNGIKGTSTNQEGVRGESDSATFAAVAGIQRNANGTGPGVWGESFGQGEGVHGQTASKVAAGVSGLMLNNTGTGAGVFGHNSGEGHGLAGETEATNNLAAGVFGVALNAKGAAIGVLGENRGGPAGFAGFFRGKVNVTDDLSVAGRLFVEQDIIMPAAADCAEEFDTSMTEIEPGTVMVLDDNGTLEPSRFAYDRKVAGVISGAGDFRPGVILDKRVSESQRAPLALVGKVYCRADASYAPIAAGDLLTTSPTPGHAMKVGDPGLAFGAVIGKALRSLDSGQGLVPILIALQ